MSELSDLLEQNSELIYRALIKQIKSAEGHGFHNMDQGHPILGHGMEEIPESERYKANFNMFRLVSSLAMDLINNQNEFVGSSEWVDLSTWDKFRDFAMDAYRRKRQR